MAMHCCYTLQLRQYTCYNTATPLQPLSTWYPDPIPCTSTISAHPACHTTTLHDTPGRCIDQKTPYVTTITRTTRLSCFPMSLRRAYQNNSYHFFIFSDQIEVTRRATASIIIICLLYFEQTSFTVDFSSRGPVHPFCVPHIAHCCSHPTVVYFSYSLQA